VSLWSVGRPPLPSFAASLVVRSHLSPQTHRPTGPQVRSAQVVSSPYFCLLLSFLCSFVCLRCPSVRPSVRPFVHSFVCVFVRFSVLSGFVLLLLFGSPRPGQPSLVVLHSFVVCVLCLFAQTDEVPTPKITQLYLPTSRTNTQRQLSRCRSGILLSEDGWTRFLPTSAWAADIHHSSQPSIYIPASGAQARRIMLLCVMTKRVGSAHDRTRSKCDAYPTNLA